MRQSGAVKERRLFVGKAGLLGWMASTAAAWSWALGSGGQAAWFVASAAGFVLMYAAIISLSAYARPTVSRTVSSHYAKAGDTVRVELRIERVTRWFPFVWLHVRDELRDVEGNVVHIYQELIYCGGREQIDIGYELERLPRGAYAFGTPHIRAGEPLGLASRRWRTGGGGSAGRLFVYPAPHKHLAPDELRRSGGSGAAATAAVASVIEAPSLVSTVRDYVHGDPLQRIHWKSTARTGELKTKELDALELRRVAVVLDDAAQAYGSGPHGRSRFEAAASAAAAVVQAARQQGLAASVRSGDGGGYAAVDGAPAPDAERRALELLAQAMPRGRDTLASVLRSRMAAAAPDTLLALVTPRLDAALLDSVASLRARRIHVTLIHIVSSTASSDVAEQQLRRQLMALGCKLLSITVEDDDASNTTRQLTGSAAVPRREADEAVHGSARGGDRVAKA